MEAVRVISTTTIKAPSSHNNDNNYSVQKIDLTVPDLVLLAIESIQRGLLFRNNERHTVDAANQIEHLQCSLSSTLAFFPPLAGRLAIVRHRDNDNDNNNNIVSSHIVCDNTGALFVHAVAPNTTVADILRPEFVPPVVGSFFQLNGVKNWEGTSKALLAVQVTELVDGIFIGVAINHVVADGKSFWHFVNSWAEISRGCPEISKLPDFQRCFLDGSIDRPILFPFTEEKQKQAPILNPRTPRPKRFFHFTKKRIAELKSKVNAEVNTDGNIISSLQALLTLLWRSVVRCQHVEPQEEVNFVVLIGVRARMVPPLAEEYFGNAALAGCVTVKAGELLDGLGKSALEMNKLISSYTHENIKEDYQSWVRTPMLLTPDIIAAYTLITSSSPRFDVYGNDFGWGKPVTVRSGDGDGLINVFAGAEEGSVDFEVCLPREILEGMGNDPELAHWIHAISN